MWGSTRYLRARTSSKYSLVPISLVEWRMLQGRSSQYFFTAETGSFSKRSAPGTFIGTCQKYNGGRGWASTFDGNSSAFDPVESGLDLAALIGGEDSQREARGATVVAVQVHGYFQSRDTVLGADHFVGAGDAVLPIERGFGIAGTMSLPDADGRVGNGVGDVEQGSICAGDEGFGEMGSGFGEVLNAGGLRKGRGDVGVVDLLA